MPKVLRIINRFNLGGITYNVSYLSRYLPGDYETLLIGGPEEADEESSLFIPRSLGIEPVLIPEMRRSPNLFRDLKAYRKIRKIIREFKPDLVHTHASKAGLLGRLAAWRSGVPVIVHTFHGHVFSGYFPAWQSALLKILERFLARRTTAIIAISNKQKNELSELHRICKADKLHVIPLGFDLKRFTENQTEKRTGFRSLFALKDDEIAVGIIGRLAPVKNHKLFIDAVFAAAEKKRIRFRAFIIGDGHTRKDMEDYIARRITQLDIQEETRALISFTGWIREVDQVLAGLDLVCLTSLNEGTPVSLIEAQAAGKFIVSTDVGGIADILIPECGLLSPPGNEKAFTKNLVHALEHFSELRHQTEEARHEILKRYSYERLCGDMNRLYGKLLSGTD
ncbi:MAG TPA: glycosyltransferase [Bacteroidia bacterium]|nr:glycosyltransferase [Bacteroidia bacterium]